MTVGLNDLWPPFLALELKQYSQNTLKSLKNCTTVILHYVNSHQSFISGTYLKTLWASSIKQRMSNSTNLNQTDLIWIESVLFTYLLWLKATIIKCFPNCLLMNLQDCLYSGKYSCGMLFFFLSFFLAIVALSCLLFNSALYFRTLWRKYIQTRGKRTLGFLFISSLFT